MSPFEFDFYENLATSFDPDALSKLGIKYKKIVMEQAQERSQWYTEINNGLKALGLSLSTAQDKPLNSTFLKTFLALTDSFSAELFPAGDIITTDLKNRASFKANPELEAQAQSLENIAMMAREDINDKLLYDWDEFVPVMNTGMQSAFLCGSAIFKVYYDEFLGRPSITHIRPENVMVAPGAKSLATAETIITLFELSENQVRSYEENGYFIKTNIFPSREEITEIETVKQTLEKISRVNTENSEYSAEKYRFAEIELFLHQHDFPDPIIQSGMIYPKKFIKGFVPYRMTLHLDSSTVLNLTRAWRKDIRFKLKRDIPLVRMQYLPGTDFKGIGLTAACLNLHQRATVIQNQIEESLRLIFYPTGILAAEPGVLKQSSFTLKSGEIKQVSAANAGMIRDNFVGVPFTPPSPMFLDYKKEIEAEIASINGLSSLKPENMSNIGTSVLLTLLDKESKPVSGVLRRFTQCVNQILKLFHRSIIDDIGEEPFGDGMTGLTNAQVYSNPIMIESICDPTLANSSLRVLQMQTVLEAALQSPQLHNLRNVYLRLYEALRITNPDSLLQSEEQLQAAQAQAQQMQEQATQQQVAAEQAIAQEKATQNQLLMADIQQKGQSSKDKIMIEAEKLRVKEKEVESNSQIAQLKAASQINVSEEKLKQQSEIEMAKIYGDFLNFLLKRWQLEQEEGRKVPDYIQHTINDFFKISAPNG